MDASRIRVVVVEGVREVERRVSVPAALEAIQATAVKVQVRKEAASACVGVGVVTSRPRVDPLKVIGVAGIAVPAADRHISVRGNPPYVAEYSVYIVSVPCSEVLRVYEK